MAHVPHGQQDGSRGEDHKCGEQQPGEHIKSTTGTSYWSVELAHGLVHTLDRADAIADGDLGSVGIGDDPDRG